MRRGAPIAVGSGIDARARRVQSPTTPTFTSPMTYRRASATRDPARLGARMTPTAARGNRRPGEWRPDADTPAVDALRPFKEAAGASMRIARRLRWFCALLALLVAAPAWSQSWPSRPVKLVVPFPAGGATDILGRALAQKLAESLGQPVVVENRPGAGGTLGSDIVAKAPPDGYTILMATTSTHSIAPSLYAKLPYDVATGFAPVVQVADSTNILVVGPSIPAKSVRELIALAKADPGRLTYGSSGNGTIVHLTAVLFETMAGVKLTHVPYKGTALAMPDVMSGQVTMIFDSIVSAQPHLKSGKVRPLGVSGTRRSPLAPELPTIAESGLPGFASDTWFGVFAPANTPAPLVARLNADINAILRQPDFRERLATLGAEAAGGTPEAFATLVRDEGAKWARVVRDAGIRPE